MTDIPCTGSLSCPTADRLREAWYRAYKLRRDLPVSASEDDRREAMAAVTSTETAYTTHRHNCEYCHGRFVAENKRLAEAAPAVLGDLKTAVKTECVNIEES